MAGNPFRKSQFLSLDVNAAREAAAADLRLDTSEQQQQQQQPASTAKTKGKVQKKVRILSPLVSPDSPATFQEHDPFSSYSNPVGISTHQDKDQGVAQGLSMLQSGQQAPYNPFVRTLANIEPRGAYLPPVGLSRDESASAAKPAMDVDTFTRMLLTGSAPSTTLPMSSTSSQSNARTSSLGDLHPESPSASDDEHVDESTDPYFESSGLVSGSETQMKKSKPPPPPPTHHHGKALPSAHSGPQTVSFADFDTPSTAFYYPPTSSSPKPQLPRSPSDLNKPLPPPPQISSPDLSSVAPGQADGPSQSPLLGPDDSNPLSKRPPPPPLSRRSSQMNSANGRPRSSSNLSRSSLADDYVDGTTTPPLKPPPPFARRPPLSVETDLPIPSSRPPPPPPSRNSKPRPSDFSRTPSTQSVSSLSNRNVSSSVGQAMPPPPPPRRGEAKRRSLDATHLGLSAPNSRRMSETSRRSSGASFYNDGGRTGSVSSVPTVDEGDSGDDQSLSATPQPKAGASQGADGAVDILADMSAMQREIDALMARSK